MRVDNLIRREIASLTAAERKVSAAILADYPFAGLQTVARLAERANVSGQTILRLISKIGFDGYSEFQQALIDEIKEQYQSPVQLRESRADNKGDATLLNSLADGAIDAIRETTALVTQEQLDAVSDLLSDPKRSVVLLGGRITDSLASYLFHHLRQIRPKVFKVPGYHEEWPEYLLRLKRNDVVVMFDVRRYQPDLSEFAQTARRQRNAQVVLVTDKWMSPVSKYSSHVLPCVIDVGTPWDTGITALLLIEGLINKVAEADWTKTRNRIESLDSLRAHTGGPREDETDEPGTAS